MVQRICNFFFEGLSYAIKNTSQGDGGNSIMKSKSMKNGFGMEICNRIIFAFDLVERELSD